MTERQNLLMPYVEHRVESILSEAECEYRIPLIATQTEIMKPLREDILACMRELYQSGKYKGTKTLNQPALQKI